MKTNALLPLTVLLLSVAGAGAALPPGASLLPNTERGGLALRAPEGAGSLAEIPVSGQPFTTALQVRTLKKLDAVYGMALAARTAAPVRKGDVILLSFAMRGAETSTEAGEAQAHCVFEQSSEPYHKSLTAVVSVGKQWKRFDLPFVAEDTLDAGKAQLGFQLGFPPQTVEIADVRLVNYGSAVRLQDLPRTKMTYPGGSADAPWRKAALARIERIRKGDLKVVVRDRAGKPVRGATVSVQMQRHAYAFGSAVAADALLANTPDGEQYRAMVKRLFNRVVLENDLKWPNWEGNRARALQAVQWLRANDIEVRGHNLVWPRWSWLPRDLQGLKDQPEALRKRIAEHIREEVGAVRGQACEWDVINEPFANHVLMDVLGNDVMADWYRLAHEADPSARLFLNDYPILGSDSEHFAHFERTIQFLLDKGAPLGGIGVQCHYGGNPPSPEKLLAGLDALARFKLPIEATELDVNTLDEELQADYLRDHLIAFFSHPATNGVVMWGFWEGRHWIPAAALWRRDWSIKPNGKVWEDLVFKQWWTDVQGKADRKGVYQTRGFLGDYAITATAGGKSRTVKASLPREGKTVTLVLE